MTVHLGTFGTRRPAVDLTFTWFGSTIRVGPNAGDLELLDFLAKARELDEGDEVGGMELTVEFLKKQIDERDWTLFMERAKENNQLMKDLLQVSRDIVTAVTIFPTGRPSDSSSGQPPTDAKSMDDSSLPAATRVARRAMTILSGRPDLKMAVWQSQVAAYQEAQDELAALARSQMRAA